MKKKKINSPPPTPSHGNGKENRKDSPSLTQQVYSVLQGGIDSLGDNDQGRPWPSPRPFILTQLVEGAAPALALKAAWETREIVQAQDRAPNITSLYKMKLREAQTAKCMLPRTVPGSATEPG